MKPEDKQAWIKDQLCRADSAIRALVSAKKQSNSEYETRIRRIREFTDTLFVKRTDAQQFELFDPEQSVEPGLDSLLSNPLRGL